MKPYIVVLIAFTMLFSACMNWNSYCGDDICSIGENCAADCGSEEYQATLSWQDNAHSEDGFEIERQTADSDFSLVERTGADQTTYTDSTLAEGTTYAYRVRAYRDDPASFSAYSNTASVETAQGGGGTGTLQDITIRVRIAKENPTTENINIVIELAQQRQARILEELETNPYALEDELIPATVRRDMPAEALGLIETPVRIDGQIQMTSFDDFETGQSWDEYTLLTNTDETPMHYALYAASDEQLLPGNGEVQGYMIGNAVVAENIEYERTPVVPRALGEQKTLHILIKGPNAVGTLPTKEQVKDRLDNGPFADFIEETSYGKTWFTNDVTDWVVTDIPLYNFHTDTAIDLQHQGIIDLANYDRVVYIVWETGGGFSCVDLCNITDGGTSYELSQSMVSIGEYYDDLSTANNTMSYFDFVMAHELGHALGVMHANSLRCTGTDPATQECTHIEYGNYFDVMGTGSYTLHFNAAMKEALGWLSENDVQYITTTGTYTLKPLEQGSGVRSLRIPVTRANGFSLEYRQPLGFDKGFENSAYVANTNGPTLNQLQEGTFVATELIDQTHPGEYDDVWALQQGNTYTDIGNGFIIGPIISATPEELTLNITRMTPQCMRKLPIIRPYYQVFIVAPGKQDLFISTEIRSADSASCDDRTAMAMLEEKNNGVTIIEAGPAMSVNLEPQSTTYASWPFNISTTAPYGAYSMNITISSDSGSISEEAYWLDVVNPLTSTLVRSQSALSPGAQDVELAVYDITSGERYPGTNQYGAYYINTIQSPAWWWNGDLPYTSLTLRVEADGKTTEYELVRGDETNHEVKLDHSFVLQANDAMRISLIADVAESVTTDTQGGFRIALCEQSPFGCYPVTGDNMEGRVTFDEETELPAPTNLVAELT